MRKKSTGMAGNTVLHFSALDGVREVPTIFGPCRVLRSEPDFQWLSDRISECVEAGIPVAVDIEAWSPVSLDHHDYFQMAQVMMISIADEPDWRAVVLVEESDVPVERWFALLSKAYLLVYNADYDIRFFHRYLHRLPEWFEDCMALHGLLIPGRIEGDVGGGQRQSEEGTGMSRHLSLAAAVSIHLNLPVPKKARSEFSQTGTGVILNEELVSYASEDASYTSILHSRLWEQIEHDNLVQIAHLESAFTSYLLTMSLNGIPVSVEEIRKADERLLQVKQETEQQIYQCLLQDRWVALGPAQNGLQGEPLNVDWEVSVMQSSPGRKKRAVSREAGSALATINRGLQNLAGGYHVRAGAIARLLLDGKGDTLVVVYKKPGDPGSGTVTTVASEAIRLNSPTWLGQYLEQLSLGLVRNTSSRQVGVFVNTIAAGLLGEVSSFPELQTAYQVCTLLRKYRAAQKLQDSFTRPWLEEHIHTKDERSYLTTRFHQTKTRSGRIASSNPNCQNIARPNDELGIDLRRSIQAPPGYLLVTADYSQYELRVAAHRSGDYRMIQIFRGSYELHRKMRKRLLEMGVPPWWPDRVKQAANEDNELQSILQEMERTDIHRWVASQVFNKPAEEISKSERSRAKAVSFGVLYGMAAPTLAEYIFLQTGEVCEPKEAQQIMDRYFRLFPKLREYTNRVECMVQTDGFSSTLLGRKRWSGDYLVSLCPPAERYPELAHLFRQRVEAVDRELFNHTIQGVNADAIKVAIMLITDAIRNSVLLDPKHEYPVLSVHDEMVVQCREENADLTAQLVENCMLGASLVAGITTVPTVVEAVVSKEWNK